MELEERIGRHGFPLRVRDAVAEFQRRPRADHAEAVAAEQSGAERSPTETRNTDGSTGRIIPEG